MELQDNLRVLTGNQLTLVLRNTLSRTLAALETPGDLSEDEKRHVIEDAGALLHAIPERQWWRAVAEAETDLPMGAQWRVPELIGRYKGWLLSATPSLRQCDGFVTFDEVQGKKITDSEVVLPFLIIRDPTTTEYSDDLRDLAHMAFNYVDNAIEFKYRTCQMVAPERAGELFNSLHVRSVVFNLGVQRSERDEALQQLFSQARPQDREVLAAEDVMRQSPHLAL